MNYENQYNESLKLFIALNIELKNAFNRLVHLDSEVSMGNKEVGIYRHLQKLIPCFDILLSVSKSDSIQSLMTLQRMIIDNYAILYLFTHNSSKEEQTLRYYLYLLDAVTSRPKIIDKFSKGIKSDLPQSIYKNAQVAKEADNVAEKNLKDKISITQKTIVLANEIVEKANWKFKDSKVTNQNKNRYSWTDLYEISKIPIHHSGMFQNYHSSYVHGLGMSIMVGREKNDVYPFKISSLDFSAIIMSLIIKILTTEFENEISKVKLHKSTVMFMNENWNKWQ